MATVNEKMTAIADAIRDKTGATDALTLDGMAADIPKVYDNGHYMGYNNGFNDGYASGEEEGYITAYDSGYQMGYGDGHSEGYTEGETAGIEVGREAAIRAWWDCKTNNNTLATYSYAFYGANFNYLEEGFSPPYTLKPVYAESMFYRSTLNKLTENEVDFSNCVSASLLFNFCDNLIEATGVNLSNVNGGISYAFNQIPNIRTLDITLGEKTGGAYAFWQMPKLENLTIGGVIAFNNVTLQHSTLLTHESLLSVLNALKDYSEDTSGTSWTMTLGSANLAKLTDAEKAIATQKGWTLT